MNIFKKLPKDIIDYIISFALDKCNKCNKIYNFQSLDRNCRIFKYRNVFQDEYWDDNNDEIVTYDLICKDCIKNYSGKIIVNFTSNTYIWIKDYTA